MARQPPALAPAPRRARSRALADLLVVAGVTVLFFLVSARVELFERVATWTLRHEPWQLDEVPLTLGVLCAGLAWFGWRRLRERSREMQARLQVEAALRLAVQRNRELARRLLRLQEDERSRIARELHDEIPQQCVAIRVAAAGIACDASAGDVGAVGEGVRAIHDNVDRLHGVVRDMLTRLRPPVLDALGLEASLRSLADGWSRRHGIACSVRIEGDCERLEDEARVALYRAAQEALTNVALHACAADVQLRLRPDPEGGSLVLTVDDDGVGMPTHAPQAGLGLLGMAERMGILGGSLELGISPRGGVRVAARVPARAEAPA